MRAVPAASPNPGGGAGSRALALPILLTVALAAAIRVAALWDDADALLREVGGLDAPQYLDTARRFVAGTWPDDKPFFWAPGYSLFLGALMHVGDRVDGLLAAQVALGTLSCALVALLAWELFGRPAVAAIAGLLAAVCGPLVYYDLQLAPASLDVFLHLSLLWLLLRARRREHVLYFFAAGVLAAASAITRGFALLALPLVTVWLWWPWSSGRQALQTRSLHTLAWLAPACLVVAAVAQHNAAGDRAWRTRPSHSSAHSAPTASPWASSGMLISYNLGINFRLGNVPEDHAQNRVEHPLCFLNYKMRVMEPTLSGASKPSAQSAYLLAKTLDSIRAQPLAWLQLMGKKLGELLHGREISRDASIDASRLENRVLAALLWRRGLAFPSGLIIPLALLGLLLARTGSRQLPLMLALLATHALFVVAFFVTTRYRLALLASLIPYAAYALCAAPAVLRNGSPRRRLGLLALTLAAFALSNHGLTPMPTRHAAFEYVHLGFVRHGQGRSEEARRAWQRALEVEPGYPQAHFQLARLESAQANPKAAMAHYAAGLQLAPGVYAARLVYAQLLLRAERRAEAAAQLRKLLTTHSSAPVRQLACRTAERAKLELRGECP
ncbi:MAG: glycosyltransferase family 39 protein [Myxococcales bacterium]|nr:glycosyltransferase family 39 protein [Myxococcales bacterium]